MMAFPVLLHPHAGQVASRNLDAPRSNQNKLGPFLPLQNLGGDGVHYKMLQSGSSDRIATQQTKVGELCRLCMLMHAIH